MFNDKQTRVLQNELDSNRIKNRSKANINLSYLEGFDIIETANMIFGFGNWSYAITSLEKVSQELNSNQNAVVCYKAIVRVDVYEQSHTKQISRQDVGFGTGIARSLADANENSAKEAVTDALKRSLRSFGNQFGNSLYDKSKNHNQANQTLPQNTQEQYQASNHQEANATFSPDDYTSLYNIGLSLVEDGDFLLVRGSDIYSKRDSIKAFGFRWDGKTKQWYKHIGREAA